MFEKLRSAVGPGRMRRTDTVKGPNCDIPPAPGMYRIRDKRTGEIVYIGQTDNLRMRAQQHARLGRFDPETQVFEYSVARSDATKDDLCLTEKIQIRRHHPGGNIYSGGNGRR